LLPGGRAGVFPQVGQYSVVVHHTRRQTSATVQLPATLLATSLGRHRRGPPHITRPPTRHPALAHLPRRPPHPLHLAHRTGIPEAARRARLGQKMKGIARTYDHVTPDMRHASTSSTAWRHAGSQGWPGSPTRSTRGWCPGSRILPRTSARRNLQSTYKRSRQTQKNPPSSPTRKGF
jgi:hypothetical protein